MAPTAVSCGGAMGTGGSGGGGKVDEELDEMQ